MVIFQKLFEQTRKPEGLRGRLMVAGMNRGHARIADWGMMQLPPLTPSAIAELGCGGGRNAAALLDKYPAAHLTALDYSPVSVAAATRCNRRLIAAGRCTVRQGDVAALDLPAAAFDLATAFETVYFWPDAAACFAQVARILRPGGAFLIVNESDGEDELGRKYEKIIAGMRSYRAEELTAALQSAGFARTQCFHHPDRPWLAVLAIK